MSVHVHSTDLLTYSAASTTLNLDNFLNLVLSNGGYLFAFSYCSWG